jgi:hypothetical protein
MAGLPRSEWVWMPHPAHLIVGRDCRFHLATYVGGFIVSTVGEYEPEAGVREIYAQSRGITLVGKGYERRADFAEKVGWVEIGHGRTYETMVFRAEPRPADEGGDCCPWQISTGNELEMAGSTDAGAAYRGHLAMCEKYAAMPA